MQFLSSRIVKVASLPPAALFGFAAACALIQPVSAQERIRPGQPGFLIEGLTNPTPARQPVRNLPPPTLAPMPQELIAEPTPEAAYGAFQRGLYVTARKMAEPLAEAGDPDAQTLLGEIYAEGHGVARDLERAMNWFEAGALGGSPSAQFEYALILMARGDEEERARAGDMMKQAADAGHALAQFNYGQIIVDGTRTDSGLLSALPYFESAAEQGIADAQYALSQIYLNASGVDEDKRAEARSWLRRAARAGFDTAQLDLAIWLIDGVAGDVDYEAGFNWMARAANGGNPFAQNRLAHLYVNAIGTRPDPVEAGKWYVLSRRAGLDDPGLADFFAGLTDEQQASAISEANGFRR